MKFLFKLVFLALILGGIGYLLLAYQIVRTEDGFYVRKKDDIGFSEPAFTKEEPRELVNKIKEKLAGIDWDELRAEARNTWSQLSNELGELSQEIDVKGTTENAKRKMAELQSEAEKRYRKLVERVENGDISWEAFQKKLGELSAWTQRQIEKLKKEIENL